MSHLRHCLFCNRKVCERARSRQRRSYQPKLLHHIHCPCDCLLLTRPSFGQTRWCVAPRRFSISRLKAEITRDQTDSIFCFSLNSRSQPSTQSPCIPRPLLAFPRELPEDWPLSDPFVKRPIGSEFHQVEGRNDLVDTPLLASSSLPSNGVGLPSPSSSLCLGPAGLPPRNWMELRTAEGVRTEAGDIRQ